MLALLALLALLTLLAEPALAELLQKLVEAVTQPLLILAQVAHLVLALLTALTVAAVFLALLECLVAQLLLLADHVAELVEGRHHVVIVAIVALGAGPRHLQVLEHRLQLFEQLARSILVARARQILQPVQHALEVLLAQHARIVAIEWTR